MAIGLFQIFLVGSLSSFLMIFIYNWVFILLYILTTTSELNIFFYRAHTVFASWVWVGIALAILYAFVIILSSIMKIKREWVYYTIIDILFFIITMLNILILGSYVPDLTSIFSSENSVIYITILSVSFVFIGIICSYTMRIATFKLYNFILNINVHNKNVDANSISREYDMFFKMITEALLFGKKNDLPVGIVGFKIYNHVYIVEKYGIDAYANVEKEFSNFVKELARGGENQCFLYNNTVYSIVYTNEDEAQKCLSRYSMLFKSHEFIDEGIKIPIDVVSAISGVDFARSKMKVSVDIVIENMMRSVSDLLFESGGKESSIMFY